MDPHPHLFLGADDWDVIRRKIEKTPCRDDWQRLCETVEDELTRPVFVEADGKKIVKFAAQRAARMAFVYRVGGDERFRDRARESLDAVIAKDTWLDPHPAVPYCLSSAGICRGVASAYDWLAEDMSNAERKAIVQACMEKGVEPFVADCSNRVSKYLYGHRTQNILAATVSGAGCLCLAIDGEDGAGDLSGPIEIARAHMLRFLEWYDEGGTTVEINGYWGSANCHTMKFMHALERKGWDGIFRTRAKKLQRMAYPQMFMSIGGKFITNFGDANYGHSKPALRNVVRILARQYQDPALQWWADELAPGDEMSIIYTDTELESKPPQDFPASCIFRGSGIGVIRGSMTDPDCVLFGLKAGRAISDTYDGSHSQFDLNSVLLEAYGETLLADHGYDRAHKKTQHHNALLVNGEGQTQERSPLSHLQDLSPSDGVEYLVARVECGYPPILQKFDRHVYRVGENVFALVDEIELSEPAKLSWSFHGKEEAKLEDLKIQCGDARLEIVPFGDLSLSTRIRDDHRLPRFEVNSDAPAGRTLAGWLLKVQRVSDVAPDASAEIAGDELRLRIGDKIHDLSIVTRRASACSDVMLAGNALFKTKEVPVGDQQYTDHKI